MSAKPLIAVTLGDPAGIGPEIIVGAWTETVIHQRCRPLVVGHPGVLRRAVELWQTDLHVQEILAPDAAEPSTVSFPAWPAGATMCWTLAPEGSTPGLARPLTMPSSQPPGWPWRTSRCDHHGPAAKRGSPPGRTHFSRPYGIAGQPLRRRELRHDALSGPGRRAAFAHRTGRGPCHAAYRPRNVFAD